MIKHTSRPKRNGQHIDAGMGVLKSHKCMEEEEKA